jgi:HEAT repeat protein
MPDLDDLLADLASGDEVRAEKAVPALAEFGEAVTPLVRNLLNSADVDTRWWATRVLASLPFIDPGFLFPALVDSAPEVRQCAALGLCGHPSDKAVHPLIAALSDQDGIVAELAARALSIIGASAVEDLLEVLKTARQSARIHAMHALSEIADARAIPAMIASLSEESVLLHYWANAGLDRMGVNMIYVKP